MPSAPDDFGGFSQVHLDRVEEVVRMALKGERSVGYLDLEDLVLEVAAHVAQRLNRFEESGAARVETWIETVAMNRLRDILQRERAQKRGSTYRHVSIYATDPDAPQLEKLLAADEAGPEAAVVCSELRASLQYFGTSLKEEQRKTLLAVYREENLQAAADSLGIARSSLYGRLATIRRLAEDAGLDVVLTTVVYRREAGGWLPMAVCGRA